MTKLCSVCSAENREEAQFCRACGTSFAQIAPAVPDDTPYAAGLTCDECGFQNKPGIRYCANCGVSLLGTVVVPRPRAPVAPDPGAGHAPPPITYPSYATVAPYPPPPVEPSTYSHEYDPLPAPDVPPAWFASGGAQESGGHSLPAAPEPPPRKSRLMPALLGLFVVALVVAGALAWWLMPGSGRAGSQASAASAAGVVTPPAEPASAAVAAPAGEMAASTPETAAAPPAEAALPLAAPATEAIAEPIPPAGADSDAQRLAAEKQRREKAARDRAQREAKAKALADQQAQAAAARAEQEAAQRRAEEAQRAKAAVPVVPPPAPAPAPPRGVREICAGRGAIAESICQSRECGAAEHTNEPLCRQLREAEDRRRNGQN